MFNTTKWLNVTSIPLIAFFFVFLCLPVGFIGFQSLQTDAGFSISGYVEALQNTALMTALWNSTKVSTLVALSTTILAFILSYTVAMTRIQGSMKQFIQYSVIFPMFLPTITYGFVLIYAFGNQGIFSKLFGGEPLFTIYGFNGLLLGGILYTLPPAFIIMQNGFQYVDRKYLLVADLMGDRPMRKAYHTILRPMSGSIAGAFVLSFILSFTDFGIPASIGGSYEVIATTLYQTMLGAIPNFQQGAIVSVFMLLPAVFGVLLLQAVDKLNFHQTNPSGTELAPHRMRDTTFGMMALSISIIILAIFIVMFIVPFSKAYPSDLTFTLDFVRQFLSMSELIQVYGNSVFVALCTAAIGVIFTFVTALVRARTDLKGRKSFDFFAMMTNTVPGMVLGLGYLLLFNDSTLKGTFLIIILCNFVHFYTTPYLMAKNALQRMDANWEVIASLLQDSWLKTVFRIILPNMKSTIIEMFSYFFIQAMVTVSGVIFLVSTETLIVSAKIKELQHFNQFNEIFLLSIFIFLTNIIVKIACEWYLKKEKKVQ